MADKYESCDIPLGQGAYGYVSQYRQKETGIYVAVKTMDVSNLKKEHWEREIEIWKQIGAHENVVPLLDHWTIRENIRAVMPLAKCNLSKYVRDCRTEMEESGTLIDGKILVDLSLMLLEGTSHLHNSTPPIIHRDLKPANILCFEGENGKIILKIADFGISKFQNQEKSNYHTAGQGTKKFQAPEVIQEQKYSTAVDVWSLGVVLFYLTTGGEFPYFTEIEDWHRHEQTINYQDLWKFSNSFFEMDDTALEGIQEVINQMIVVEKRTRISTELAWRKISNYQNHQPATFRLSPGILRDISRDKGNDFLNNLAPTERQDETEKLIEAVGEEDHEDGKQHGQDHPTNVTMFRQVSTGFDRLLTKKKNLVRTIAMDTMGTLAMGEVVKTVIK